MRYFQKKLGLPLKRPNLIIKKLYRETLGQQNGVYDIDNTVSGIKRRNDK